MAKLMFLLSFLVFAGGIVAQDKKDGEFEFTAKNGDHEVKLVVRTKVFVRSRHKVLFILRGQRR